MAMIPRVKAAYSLGILLAGLVIWLTITALTPTGEMEPFAPQTTHTQNGLPPDANGSRNPEPSSGTGDGMPPSVERRPVTAIVDIHWTGSMSAMPESVTIRSADGATTVKAFDLSSMQTGPFEIAVGNVLLDWEGGSRTSERDSWRGSVSPGINPPIEISTNWDEAVLVGRAIRAGSGIGIPDLIVTLRRGSSTRSVLTGAEGQFRFENLPAGIYLVRVGENGLIASDTFTVRGPRTDAEITIPAASLVVTVEASTPGILHGATVRLESLVVGEPLDVSADRIQYLRSTLKDGVATITPLHSGLYRGTVEFPRDSPDAKHPVEFGPISIGKRDRQHSVRVSVPDLITMDVKVTNRSGDAVKGAALFGHSADGRPLGHSLGKTDDRGEATVALRSRGVFKMSAISGRLSGHADIGQPVVLEDRVEIVVDSGCHVIGQLVDEESEDLILIGTRKSFASLRIIIRSDSGMPWPPQPGMLRYGDPLEAEGPWPVELDLGYLRPGSYTVFTLAGSTVLSRQSIAVPSGRDSTATFQIPVLVPADQLLTTF